ncbi:MAG: transglycosylase SLT domain-containing protein [Burkholderiaceae bacterium]|jgi:membrane-bound lytic murein transglycosylase D|nr:transglycosylase SLT domain-containing protein [Burkholderiaceae bacterium]
MTTRLLALIGALLLAGCAATPSHTDTAAPSTPEVPVIAPAQVAQSAPEPQAAQMAAAKRASRTAGTGLDPENEAARTDLWVRVRRGFAIPDLDTDLVRKGEQWYSSRPDYVQRMTERSSRYMFYIVEEIERRGMPTEIALLPFIESAFNPQAISSAKASGMWQFMAATGKDFDLKQNVFRDDRRNVIASTRAALDYLTKLHDQFGDWQLALAAYNWGEGSVQRAIDRNQRAGKPTDYLSLKMPEETRYYVPKLQAVKNIVADPAGFGLTLPPLPNHPYFLSVPIERDIDVALAVQFSGVSMEEFKTLNPQMNKPVILAAGTPQILLPYDNANQFLHRLAAYNGSTASWTAWVAPKTLKPAAVAEQVGMSEATLRDVNRIPPKMLVKAGSTLIVPRDAKLHADVPEHVADGAMLALAPDLPPLRKKTLKAGKKDSVASIARRYRVSKAQVAEWNDVAETAHFKRGQTVVVYVPGKRVRVAAGDSRKGAAHAKPAASAKSKPVRVASKSTKKPAKKVANAGKHNGAASVRVAESGSRESSNAN